jgi:hypothetical protein
VFCLLRKIEKHAALELADFTYTEESFFGLKLSEKAAGGAANYCQYNSEDLQFSTRRKKKKSLQSSTLKKPSSGRGPPPLPSFCFENDGVPLYL